MSAIATNGVVPGTSGYFAVFPHFTQRISEFKCTDETSKGYDSIFITCPSIKSIYGPVDLSMSDSGLLIYRLRHVSLLDITAFFFFCPSAVLLCRYSFFCNTFSLFDLWVKAWLRVCPVLVRLWCKHTWIIPLPTTLPWFVSLTLRHVFLLYFQSVSHIK